MNNRGRSEKALVVVTCGVLFLTCWLMVGYLLETFGVNIIAPKYVLVFILVLTGVATVISIVDTVAKPLRNKKKENHYKNIRNDLRLYVNDFETVQYDVVNYEKLKEVTDLSKSIGTRNFEFIPDEDDNGSLKGVYNCQLDYAGDDGLILTTKEPVIMKYVKGIEKPVLKVKLVSEDKQVEGFSKFINPTLCIPNK
ncbi:hypothetical protein ACTFR8_22170 [Bacillus cereus group sp. MYBK15-3]|uniref:hypothetical protein n=1 Tax=Bacillus cereus group TaxID=86661 RepID=UPI001C8B5A92|nr:hypothetical protein [Bacillus cereus]MBX9158307.1 hypothetical protein [Bacillus cereus]